MIGIGRDGPLGPRWTTEANGPVGCRVSSRWRAVAESHDVVTTGGIAGSSELVELPGRDEGSSGLGSSAAPVRPLPPSSHGSAGEGEAERESERRALAVLATVDGLGPATLGRLIGRLGGAGATLAIARGPGGAGAIENAARDAERGRPSSPDVAEGVVQAATRSAEILERIRRADLDFVTLDDATYPTRLRGIALPPHVLFVRGHVEALSTERAVAVVGTRRPTAEGRRTAARIGSALARAGACVVSGLAVGIDGAAHAAVVAERAPTVAVLGGGHDRLFPRAHARLADAIVAAGGAVVSELPPDAEPLPGTFPRRNRVISGLTEATVVVEAGARSGALTTAAWALEQGRGCFLVPGSIDAPMSAGCLAFLRECSAEARVVAGVPQLLEDLGLVGNRLGPRAEERARLVAGRSADSRVRARSHLRPPAADGILVALGQAERVVAAALIDGAATADELVAVVAMPIAAVLGALTLLEIRGLVVGAYGRYRPSGALAAEPPEPRRARSARR